MSRSGQSIEQVKDTVRKLLNLAANDAAADGEIQNALNFAQKMMAKYHLSEADIPSDNPDIQQIDSVDVSNFTYKSGGSNSQGVSLSSWECGLGTFIQRFVGSVVVYQQTEKEVQKTTHGTIQFDNNGKPIKKQKMVFTGTEDDVTLCEQLFDEIALTISVMARMKFGSYLRGPGRAYGDGFVSSLFTKLKQSQQLLAAPTSDSTTLVIRATNALTLRKKNQAQAFLSSKGIRLGSAVSSKVKNYSDAYSSGQQDGSSFNASQSKKSYDRSSRKRLT